MRVKFGTNATSRRLKQCKAEAMQGWCSIAHMIGRGCVCAPVRGLKENEKRRTIDQDPTACDGAVAGDAANVGHEYGCGATAAVALAGRSASAGARDSLDRLSADGVGACAAEVASGDAELGLLLLGALVGRCSVLSAARRCCAPEHTNAVCDGDALGSSAAAVGY